MPELWTLHIAPDVARTIYTLPRGQATDLRDALARLREDPHRGATRQIVDDLPGLHSIEIGRYRIEYQIVDSAKIVRILFVE